MGSKDVGLVSKLLAFQKEGFLCDTTVISAEDTCIDVHALVLAAASPGFKERLGNHTRPECGHYVIKSSMTEVDLTDFVCLAYGGDSGGSSHHKVRRNNVLTWRQNDLPSIRSIDDSNSDINDEVNFSEDEVEVSSNGTNRPIDFNHVARETKNIQYAADENQTVVQQMSSPASGDYNHDLLSVDEQSVIEQVVLDQKDAMDDDNIILVCYDTSETKSLDFLSDGATDNIQYQIVDKDKKTVNKFQDTTYRGIVPQAIDHHNVGQQTDDTLVKSVRQMGYKNNQNDGGGLSAQLPKTEKTVTPITPVAPSTSEACENSKQFTQVNMGDKSVKYNSCGTAFIPPLCTKRKTCRKKKNSDSQKNSVISNDEALTEQPTNKTSPSVAKYVLPEQIPSIFTKRFSCVECGKMFARNQELRVHERSHTGEKPYMCRWCGKKYTQLAHVRAHERVHTGDKPFKCTQCDKSFSQRGSLNIHLRIHCGIKPYTCSFCDKDFSLKTNLERHIEMHHTVEKLHSCDMCGKTFGGLKYKKLHEKTHLKSKNEAA